LKDIRKMKDAVKTLFFKSACFASPDDVSYFNAKKFILLVYITGVKT